MRMLAGAVVILAGAILCGATVLAKSMLVGSGRSDYTGFANLSELLGVTVVGFGFVIIVVAAVIDIRSPNRSTHS